MGMDDASTSSTASAAPGPFAVSGRRATCLRTALTPRLGQRAPGEAAEVVDGSLAYIETGGMTLLQPAFPPR